MKAYKKTKRMKKSSLSGLVPTSSQTPKGGEMERESGGGGIFSEMILHTPTTYVISST